MTKIIDKLSSIIIATVRITASISDSIGAYTVYFDIEVRFLVMSSTSISGIPESKVSIKKIGESELHV